jgi:hypothetical protein
VRPSPTRDERRRVASVRLDRIKTALTASGDCPQTFRLHQIEQFERRPMRLLLRSLPFADGVLPNIEVVHENGLGDLLAFAQRPNLFRGEGRLA